MVWKWDKAEAVVSELRRLQSAGEDMRPKQFRRKHHRLFEAGRRFFGGTWPMYKAAGMDPKKLGFRRPRRKWNKENVVSTLQQYYQEGIDVSVGSLHDYDSGLYDAGGKIFGSLPAMYEAAGVPHVLRKPPGYWTKDRMIEAIRKRASEGKDMRYGKVILDKEQRNLAGQADVLFGGWYQALEAAGLDPSKHRIQQPSKKSKGERMPRGYWSKQRVIDRIRERHAEKRGLGDKSVRADDYALLKGSQGAFGSWYNALKAAGISDVEYRTKASYDYWTNERVLNQIRLMARRGDRLDAVHAVRTKSKLHSAACDRFGTWGKALTAAGFDHEAIRRQRKPYTKEEMLEILSSLKAQGQSLSYSSIAGYSSGLVTAISDAFGGYRKAIEALGLDYDAIRKDRMQESFKGLLFEYYVGQVLRVLGRDVEPHRYFKFGKAKLVPDFYDNESGAWIEVKYSSWTPEVGETIRKYLAHKDKIMIIYLKESRTKKLHWDPGRVESVPISSFYSELKKKGAGTLVENIELLRRGVIFKPEYQSRLRDFMSSRYARNPHEIDKLIQTMAR